MFVLRHNKIHKLSRLLSLFRITRSIQLTAHKLVLPLQTYLISFPTIITLSTFWHYFHEVVQ